MSSNRHVPLVVGVISLGLAAWLILGLAGWWRFVPGSLLIAFGWVSLKTALFASNQEIKELTGGAPLSDETSRNFSDRL